LRFFAFTPFFSGFGAQGGQNQQHPAAQEGRIVIVTDVGREMRWTLATAIEANRPKRNLSAG
jgi:hypothetical protein